MNTGWKVVLLLLLCHSSEDTQASLSAPFFFFFKPPLPSHLNWSGGNKHSRLHLTASKTNFGIVVKATGEQIWSHLD